MKRRILLVVLAISIAIVGCGKTGQSVQKEEKDELVQEVISEEVTEEVAEEKENVSEEEQEVTTEEQEKQEEQKAEKENTPARSEQKKPTTTSQTTTKKEETKTPVASTPVVAPTQPENKVETCDHRYDLESKSYEYIEQMVWACNGCGYPLFTIENGKPVNFSDMYSHPAYYSEKLGRECTGGGFHSEMFHSGFCGVCHDAIMWRQCMFSEMGKTCVKNNVLGAYEKVELGQNPRAFWKSCSCGMDQIYVGQATLDNNSGGLLLIKETCKYCGEVVNYPKK